MQSKKIGNLLRQKRKEKGLTLKDLANLTNLSKAYISNLESGYVSINLKLLETLGISLDFKVVDFIDEVMNNFRDKEDLNFCKQVLNEMENSYLKRKKEIEKNLEKAIELESKNYYLNLSKKEQKEILQLVKANIRIRLQQIKGEDK